MGDQAKKISFGFSKLAKKTAIVSTHLNKNKPDDEVNKVEFIDCLEGKSIKLKDPIKLDQGPLVIPLTRKKDEKNSSQQVNLESIGLQKELQNKPTNESCETVSENNSKSCKTDEINQNNTPRVNETLDEAAAREILEELNRKKTGDDETRIFNVPLTSNAPSGEKESSLEDYDNIPVTEFGVAMLRGMGWAPGKGIGKNEKLVAPTLPAPRPKGMGLGADKVIKSVAKKSSNEELKMVKGSYVRVIAGPEKDTYGQIQGFDDESGRLIVKLAFKNDSISLNEFMVQLVDSNEFKKNSKVINVGKYEQYKADEVKEESNGNRSLKDVHGKTQNRESISKTTAERFDSNKSKVLMRKRSSSLESEEGNLNDGKTRQSSDYSTLRNAAHKRSSSKSPYARRNESPKSQSTSHRSQSTKHEPSSKYHDKSSMSGDKKHRSRSSDSSGSCSSYKISKKNKTVSSKSKSPVKYRSASRRRSSSNSSTSDSSGKYSRRKESKHKKKKSRSNKYRSRSRSRSPRKHKHKKSKK